MPLPNDHTSSRGNEPPQNAMVSASDIPIRQHEGSNTHDLPNEGKQDPMHPVTDSLNMHTAANDALGPMDMDLETDSDNELIEEAFKGLLRDDNDSATESDEEGSGGKEKGRDGTGTGDLDGHPDEDERDIDKEGRSGNGRESGNTDKESEDEESDGGGNDVEMGTPLQSDVALRRSGRKKDAIPVTPTPEPKLRRQPKRKPRMTATATRKNPPKKTISSGTLEHTPIIEHLNNPTPRIINPHTIIQSTPLELDAVDMVRCPLRL